MCRFIRVVFDSVDIHECAHNFMIYLTDVCIEGHVFVKVHTEVLFLTGRFNCRVVKCECYVVWDFRNDLPCSYEYTLSFLGI